MCNEHQEFCFEVEETTEEEEWILTHHAGFVWCVVILFILLFHYAHAGFVSFGKLYCTHFQLGPRFVGREKGGGPCKWIQEG